MFKNYAILIPGRFVLSSKYALIALIVSLAALTGCVSQPRISVGDMPPAAPKADRAAVPTGYLIGCGDVLDVSYDVGARDISTPYLIDVGDTLRIGFDFYPEMNRTVQVRPDGVITVPRLGDVKVVDQQPTQVAKNLAKLYQPHLTKPQVIVEVVDFNKRLQELKAAITTRDRGQSRLVLVRPDGRISLPFVQDAKAAGLSPQELSNRLAEKYQRYIKGIGVNVAVFEANSNLAYIMGEVRRPNFYKLSMPMTLTQLISSAGGFADYANVNQVVVISRQADGSPAARVINMDDVIGQGNIANDVFIKQYDVVWVPRTALGDASLFGEAIWKLIPLRFGVNAGYELGGTQAD